MADELDLRIRQLELAAELADNLAAKMSTMGSTDAHQAAAKKNVEHWLEIFDQAYTHIVEASKS